MIVYCAQNTLNGKRYIGITTVSLDARWAQHLGAARGGKTTPLHREEQAARIVSRTLGTSRSADARAKNKAKWTPEKRIEHSERLRALFAERRGTTETCRTNAYHRMRSDAALRELAKLAPSQIN